MDSKTLIVSNPWEQLRQFTAARIALGRTGVSLPTQPQLAFQLAHAQARDAVHLPLDTDQLLLDLQACNLTTTKDAVVLDSAAGNRLEYLQRPDLGRCLNEASREQLKARQLRSTAKGYDIAVVVADGLSSLAVAQNAAPFLAVLTPMMAAGNLSLAPLVIVRQGRVAIGDDVGDLLGAQLVLLLIGERPGLSSPDSMGIYMTWAPRAGLSDADRNCISNLRPAGLPYEEAARKVAYLMAEMRRRQLSGVALKDETTPAATLSGTRRGNFLLENQQ